MSGLAVCAGVALSATLALYVLYLLGFGRRGR